MILQRGVVRYDEALVRARLYIFGQELGSGDMRLDDAGAEPLSGTLNVRRTSRSSSRPVQNASA